MDVQCILLLSFIIDFSAWPIDRCKRRRLEAHGDGVKHWEAAHQFPLEKGQKKLASIPPSQLFTDDGLWIRLSSVHYLAVEDIAIHKFRSTIDLQLVNNGFSPSKHYHDDAAALGNGYHYLSTSAKIVEGATCKKSILWHHGWWNNGYLNNSAIDSLYQVFELDRGLRAAGFPYNYWILGSSLSSQWHSWRNYGYLDFCKGWRVECYSCGTQKIWFESKESYRLWLRWLLDNAWP